MDSTSRAHLVRQLDSLPPVPPSAPRRPAGPTAAQVLAGHRGGPVAAAHLAAVRASYRAPSADLSERLAAAAALPIYA